MSERGRVLGVDHGTVRVGLAVSDADRRIASPLAIYARSSRERDAQFFRELVKKEDIVHIVVGLPAFLDGHEGGQAHKVRGFGQWLGGVTALPISFFDESYTTWEAEGHLLSAGLTSKRRKARRDQLAAQIFLQAYLDKDEGRSTNDERK